MLQQHLPCLKPFIHRPLRGVMVRVPSFFTWITMNLFLNTNLTYDTNINPLCSVVIIIYSCNLCNSCSNKKSWHYFFEPFVFLDVLTYSRNSLLESVAFSLWECGVAMQSCLFFLHELPWITMNLFLNTIATPHSDQGQRISQMTRIKILCVL